MIVDVRELSKEYRRGERIFPAVDHVSFALDRSDFVCIMGRSGSGKSTLLNMVAGLVKPSSGCVEIEGQDVSTMDDRQVSLLRNSRLGYVPQGQNVLPNLSVLDNVRLPFFLSKRTGEADKRASDLLDHVGIPHLASSWPQELSGGELRRVAIARALMNSPILLIADEPTGDLDVETTREVMTLFQEITRKGTAVLMVTHDPEASGYASRTYGMSKGVLSETRASR